MNYLIKKIKQNVYSLTLLSKNNLKIYKILKVSVNEQEYLNEYNIYKELLVEDKTYNVENLSTYLTFKNIPIDSNIDLYFNEEDITINISVISLVENDDIKDIIKNINSDNLINLYILCGNYNPTNKTLSAYILTDDFKLFTLLINNALLNRKKASVNKNLKHCDFKTNNILINSSLDVYLFDFDFSVLLNDNDTIRITDDQKVNLYLNLNIGDKITGKFLDLFDIYLLALSIIYGYNTGNSIQLVKLQNYFEECLINKTITCCSDFYIFYIIFSNILKKLPRYFDHETYLYYASYIIINSILSNIIIDFTKSTHLLLLDDLYLDAINFIVNNIDIY
jgi:hypothetical protein